MLGKILLIAHGDLDGIISAALEIQNICRHKNLDLNEILSQLIIEFVQPYKLEKIGIPMNIEEIYIVDIGINSQDPNMTRDFIGKIGQRLIRWCDHHQGWSNLLPEMPEEIRNKFMIDENALACALIINASSKLTEDAIAADTREKELSDTGKLLDQALKSDPGNYNIKIAVVKYLLGDERYRCFLKNAAYQYRTVQLPVTQQLIVENCRVENGIAVVDVRNATKPYDRTLLSMLAKNLSPTGTVILLRKDQRGETMLIATSQEGIDLTKIFGLLGGHPNRILVPVSEWIANEAIRRLKEALNKSKP